MDSYNYTTKEGETWASIAWSQYKSMAYIQTLIEANPQVPIDLILPVGTKLVIPIIEVSTTIESPAWK